MRLFQVPDILDLLGTRNLILCMYLYVLCHQNLRIFWLSASCLTYLNIVVSLDKSASANSATQRIPTSSLCSYGQDSETYRPFYGSEEYGTSRNLNVAGEDDMGQSIANDASKLLLVASNGDLSFISSARPPVADLYFLGVNEIFRHSYGQALAPVLPSSSQVVSNLVCTRADRSD